MKRIIIIVCLFIAVVSNAQINKSKMDSLFYQLDKNNKAMASVSIHQKGKEIYSNTIGYSNLEANEKANANTLYRIGSISKMFTAVLMYQLFEEKKIHPNTTINYFFPFIKNSKSISIAMLLNHSSGIHNFTADTNYMSYMEKPKTEQELIDIFNKMPADFEPGTKNEYSNTNYVLLSIIIEKIGKAPYAKQLQQRICDKLHLEHTFYGKPNERQKNETFSYSFEEGKWQKEKQTDLSIPKGAGAILSTANDLCTFIEGLFNGQLVSEASLNEMKTIKNGFGKGLFEVPFYDKTALGHTGGIDGFESILTYFEKEKTAYCMVGNAYDYPMNDISIGVLSLLFKKPYQIPTFEKRVLNAQQLKTKTGAYSNAKLNMTITISETDKQLFAQATGQSAFPLEKVNETDYKFDAANIQIHFNINKDGNISSFMLKQGGMDLLFEK